MKYLNAHLITPVAVIITAVVSALLLRGVMAAEAPLKILSTIAVEGALTDLEPMLQKSAGVPVQVQFSTTNQIVESLSKGEAADMVILTQDAVKELVAKNAVKMPVDLVQSEVGIAVADNAPTPAMKTTDDFIAFMKATPSVAYTATGASGLHMAQTIEKLGIANIVKPKAIIVANGFAATQIREGKAASAVQQVSELKFGGAKNIVPFPDAIQSRLIFSAATTGNSKSPDAAAKVARLLVSADAAAAYKRFGLNPVFR